LATKKEELEKALRGEGCLGKSADDEPVFILCARDELAAGLILEWAILARARGARAEKVAEAEDLARSMIDWGRDHGTRTPD
jgi:hypothetical protein